MTVANASRANTPTVNQPQRIGPTSNRVPGAPSAAANNARISRPLVAAMLAEWAAERIEAVSICPHRAIQTRVSAIAVAATPPPTHPKVASSPWAK